MTVAAAVARALAQAGIDRVFGLPGGEVLVLIDELRQAGIDFVLMRHEANAGLAAAVYGKMRGQPGVVLATLGPGAVIGELSLLDHGPRTATVSADTDCTMLVISQRQFLAVIDAIPAISHKLLATLAGRIRELDRQYFG